MNILNGIDAADRRIREQSRIAGQYTRMSNAAANSVSHPAGTDPPVPPHTNDMGNHDIHNHNIDDNNINEPENDLKSAPADNIIPGNIPESQDERSSREQPQDNDNDYYDILGHAAGQIAAALNTDGERLLILALIVILGSEGADIALLAALAYLLI